MSTMRTLHIVLNKNERRSPTTAIINGENRLVMNHIRIEAHDPYLILQDSFGTKKRIPITALSKDHLSENVRQFSSFWFECASLDTDQDIEVELK